MLNRACVVALGFCLATSCDRTKDSSVDHTKLARAEGRAPDAEIVPGCEDLPSSQELERYLKVVPSEQEAGGLASGKAEWAAMVNRGGVLCAIAVSMPDPAQAWVGSQGIAKAKAFTANAFSTDAVAMSTARLYTLSQPGHSLFGIASGNPLDPTCLSTPEEKRGLGKVCGGSIAFGGGVPLYKGKRRMGGLGLSGDTACADHEIAKRLRAALGLDPPNGARADEIQYRGVDPPTVFAHPLCINTYRDGKKLGDEALLPDEATRQ
jgi:uncharacterized protein GlcG (DUF336 family)